jgi:RNA 2',3'-cyclic 3'-phosphodiesterase
MFQSSENEMDIGYALRARIQPVSCEGMPLSNPDKMFFFCSLSLLLMNVQLRATEEVFHPWEVEMLEYRQASLTSPDGQSLSRGKSRQTKHPSALFFVLKPDPRLCPAMHDMASRHAQNYGKGKACPPHLLHLSLLNVGVFEQPPYELAMRIGDAVNGIPARPVHVTLDRSMLFGNGQHLVLTNAHTNSDLRAFVRRLHAILTRHNLPRAAIRSIQPHVTVIYGYRAKELPSLKTSYAWLASDFSLIYSHSGESRHEELGRWRLDPDAEPYPWPTEQLRLFD